MSMDSVWAALALVLVIEGLLPFLSPKGWKRAMSRLVRMQDAQIRLYAFLAIAAGLLMLWLR